MLTFLDCRGAQCLTVRIPGSPDPRIAFPDRRRKSPRTMQNSRKTRVRQVGNARIRFTDSAAL
jgi:hypothetical protein